MPSVETPSVSRSGIATSSTGERHIPASTRADGSVRKEIKVRPGYRPPEDVEVYKNRTAEGWKNRGNGGIPGAESATSMDDAAASSTGANKNAKRREARKKAAAAAAGNLEHAGSNGAPKRNPAPTDEKEDPPMDPEAVKEKEAKKLLKKLRQAGELKDKKEKGDKLLPEQFEKIIKINELIRQLDGLGFDPSGEKKGEGS